MSQQQGKGTTGATVVPLGLTRDVAVERYVQGDLAGMAHLMEQAYSTASTAHAIAKRRRGAYPVRGDRLNSLQVQALDRVLESMGEAEGATQRALQDVVAATALLCWSYRPAATP
jgi:hypothetical protein